MLYRSGLREKLKDIFNMPIFIVDTGMGYGKTTAVQDFLRHKKRVQCIWLSFEEETVEDMWLWVRFSRRIERVNTHLGNKVLSYGIPYTVFEKERLISTLRDEIETEMVLVFDDMHLCKSPIMRNIIAYIASAEIPMLHIVMLTRDLKVIESEERIEQLLESGKGRIINEEDLAFSYSECSDFFTLNDARLSTEELDMLWEKTHGWASGLYLAFSYYLKFGTLEGMPEDIIEQLRRSIYSGFDEATKESLLMLSKIPSFTLEQAEIITADRYINSVVSKMHKSFCFTKYDEFTGRYSFHSIMENLFREECEKTPVDEKLIFFRQGSWCLASDDQIGAIDYYTRCGEYERILTIIAGSSTTLMNMAPNIIVNAFENMDLETRLSNPIGYLAYIYMYSVNFDVEKGYQMLNEAKAFYSDEKKSPDLYDRNQILGEIALIESVRAFNDIYEMFRCYERAYEYFDGGSSMILTSDVNITFGIPLNMFLYHKKQGELDDMIMMVEEKFWIYDTVTNGSGAGFEYLLKAEYDFKRGKFEEAEMLAYKAIYKAKTREQTDIILSALFVLVRIALFRRQGREVNEFLTQMMQEVEKNGNPVMLSCYEIILGYVLAFLGNFETLPKWISEEENDEKHLMAIGRNSAYIMRGKILSERQEFEKLNSLSDRMIDYYGKHGYLDGVIIFKVFKATAIYHLESMEAGAVFLKEALDIAMTDGICVTVAENTEELIPMLEYIDTPFARRVLGFNKSYVSSKYSFRNREKQPGLTKREHEVMKLVAEGLTADAISKKLFVSHSTVKKHIARAYEKLGVNKKADAIAAYKKMMKR